MKANNIKSNKRKRKITKQEIRRRLKTDPEKTIKFLKEHQDKLSTVLLGKIKKFLDKHQNINASDIAAVDQTLASDATEDVIIETDQEGEEEETAGSGTEGSDDQVETK